MNAFNPITTMQKLEAVGMDRRQAETLADEFHHATTELVTKDELTKALDAQAKLLRTLQEQTITRVRKILSFCCVFPF